MLLTLGNKLSGGSSSWCNEKWFSGNTIIIGNFLISWLLEGLEPCSWLLEGVSSKLSIVTIEITDIISSLKVTSVSEIIHHWLWAGSMFLLWHDTFVSINWIAICTLGIWFKWIEKGENNCTATPSNSLPPREWHLNMTWLQSWWWSSEHLQIASSLHRISWHTSGKTWLSLWNKLIGSWTLRNFSATWFGWSISHWHRDLAAWGESLWDYSSLEHRGLWSLSCNRRFSECSDVSSLSRLGRGLRPRSNWWNDNRTKGE